MSTETASTIEAFGAIFCVLLATYVFITSAVEGVFSLIRKGRRGITSSIRAIPRCGRLVLDHTLKPITLLRGKINSVRIQRKIKRHAQKCWGE
jgi:hypothetical protein